MIQALRFIDKATLFGSNILKISEFEVIKYPKLKEHELARRGKD